MKRKILILVLFMLLFTNKVYANETYVNSSISFDTANKKAILTISSNEHIGQIWGNFSCGELGNIDLTFVANSDAPTQKNYYISYSANYGSYTCSVNGLRVGTLESAFSGVKSYNGTSKTLNLGNPPQSQSQPQPSAPSNPQPTGPTKSNNNFLKNLYVENYNLNQEFNRDNLEYYVDVPLNTKSVNIGAEAEDGKASISGDTGLKDVNSGENRFNIIVTAENGEQRNYVIVFNVEKDPIIIKIDNKDYKLIEKEEFLPELQLDHEVMSLNISDREIKAYRINDLKYILVGLRDENNNVNLYRFISYKDDEKPAEYSLFQVFKIGDTYYSVKQPSEELKGYKKKEITINGIKLNAYALGDKMYAIYAMNVSTEKESFYKYDEVEGTIQRFILDTKRSVSSNDSNYYKIILILGICLFASFIINIFISFKKTRSSEEKKLLKQQRKQEKENKKIKKQEEINKEKQLKKEEKMKRKKAKKIKNEEIEEGNDFTE